MIRLAIHNSIPVIVDAREMFSGTPAILVQKGETYAFACASGQKWKDWIFSYSPEGGFSPAKWFFTPRIPKAPYFRLCGAIDKNEDHLFEIGSKTVQIDMLASGVLYFFANDFKSKLAYDNNRKKIQVEVTRLS